MKTVISKVLSFVVTFSSFISICEAADQYKFLGTIPSNDPSLKEPSAAAMTSARSCYIADPGSKAVYHYDQTGKSLEVLKQLTVGTSKVELKDPVDLYVDRQDNLYILDNDLGTVLVRLKNGEVRRVGEQGSALGFIDDGRSLAVDKNGNIYVLSAGEERVEIFNPQGNFLTWINSAASQNFLEPVAIGMNGADELFVLEAKSGTVYIFDAEHNPVATLSDLAKKSAIKNPVDITVLSNGEFIIIDSENCKAVHFNRNGDVLSVIGSKGTPAKGVFADAIAVSGSPTLPDVMVVVDETAKSVQVFQVPVVSSPLSSETEPTELKLMTDDVIPPFIDFAVAPNGTRYVIPVKDRRSVHVYKPGDKQPSMKLNADEPAALAADASGNIYVLDKDNEEVLMYDSEGVMIRKFGQEMSERLKDANGITVLTDGSVLVADTKDACVKRWSAQGVYQGVLIKENKTILPAPYKIKADAKNNIYVWDNYRSVILRFDRQGWLSRQELKLRTLKASENNGKIMGIAIDVINQFYVFNQTTGQIEVYDWKDVPVCIFRYGRPSKGNDGFDDVEAIGLNPKNFVLYAAYDDKTVKAIRMPFTDYVGKGDQLYSQQQYDEAWQVYMTGYQRMEKPEALRKYIAKRYSTAGMTLTSRYDLVRGMGYLKQALSLEPENTFSQEALCYGYKMCFKKYALEEDYDELIKTSEQMVEEFQPQTSEASEKGVQNLRVMQSALLALDSISTELVKSKSEKKIQTAVQIHTRLTTWDKANVKYLTGLTQANWAFYTFLKSVGAPGFELQALLKKAEEASQSTLDEIKKTPNANKTQSYIRAELLYVEILLEGKNYEKAVSICVNALINPDLGREMVVKYRELLTNAYIGQGSYDSAATEYQRILALDTGSKIYRLKLADVLVLAKRYDDAKALYQQLLIEQRDNAMLTGRIGKVELLKKNYEEASFQIEKALKLSASERDLYGPLAEAYDGASKFKQAIQNYKIAIQQLQQQQSYLRSRISSGQEIDNIQRQISEYLTNLGEIYLRIGKYDDAIESCKEVTTISPGRADGWLNLGNAYMKTGLIYEAIRAFNSAQQLDPSSKPIQQALADAQRLKEKSSQNSPAVEIVKVDINDVFPSLYRNYADISMQPIGEVVLANNTLLPISGVSLTFFVNGLMAGPSSQQVNALVGYSNMAVKLSAIFDQKILANTQDKKLQAVIVVKYTHDGIEKTIEKT
ncbi:MAG: tetratricopeptide repeat protein, partial [Chlorobiales bacterium]|nr:tetratricopeptide repeat protein [Chlorobiales bacterium]